MMTFFVVVGVLACACAFGAIVGAAAAAVHNAIERWR